MNTQKQDRMQGNKPQNQSDKKPGQQNQQGQKPGQQQGGDHKTVQPDSGVSRSSTR